MSSFKESPALGVEPRGIYETAVSRGDDQVYVRVKAKSDPIQHPHFSIGTTN